MFDSIKSARLGYRVAELHREAIRVVTSLPADPSIGHLTQCRDVLLAIMEQVKDLRLQIAGLNLAADSNMREADRVIEWLKLNRERALANIRTLARALRLRMGEAGPAFELNAAAYCGDFETVRRVLEEGVNLNEVVEDFGTALHSAAGMGREHVVRMLLNSGADVNVIFEGETPLKVAIGAGHSEIVAILRQRGALG